MPKDKNFLEQVSDALAIPERTECDNVVRWDGRKLYVLDTVWRNDRKVDTRQRDVSHEVADFLRKK
jgi:hypothetical protein